LISYSLTDGNSTNLPRDGILIYGLHTEQSEQPIVPNTLFYSLTCISATSHLPAHCILDIVRASR
jgi:hypothetical protein